jgi:hypothetical protein
MKVLIIPEDPTLDRYILKPIVERIFADHGQRARIEVLQNPRLRGVAQALDGAILTKIMTMYPMIDLFLVMVDRDGQPEKRSASARARESEHAGQLLVCLAIEEIEVWMLALHREAINAPWQEIRREHHPKERFAKPFLAEHAPRLAPGGGRAWAMRPLGSKWRGVLTVCEELDELKARIGMWLQAR